MSAKFESKGNKLFIDEHEVIKGWESFSGWYWFATEFVDDDDNGEPLWFGFVQGMEEEWGTFSEAGLKALGSQAWEIPQKNLSFSGRRN